MVVYAKSILSPDSVMRTITKKQQVLGILGRIRDKDPVFDAYYDLISFVDEEVGREVIEYLDIIIERFLVKCERDEIDGHLADLADTRTHLAKILAVEETERADEKMMAKSSTTIL